MPGGDNGSVQEIQWLIEERKRRMDDVEEQLSRETDDTLKTGLKGMLTMLRSEIAELEREMDEKAPEEDDNEEALKDIDSKIRDINSQLELETDKIVRNNLEVSKRFLQMERNALLIKMTQKVERKDPMEEKVEELTRVSSARLQCINDLERKLKEAEKQVSYYKTLAENPERGISCDTTRVYVEAGVLTELRNNSKLLAINNGNLKMENRELRNQMDLLSKNVIELTKHCKEADSQILILQSKVIELRKQLEDRQ